MDEKTGAQKIIIDKNLALKIGDAIIKSTYSKEGYADTKLIITDYENKDIYVVSRIPKDPAVIGNEISVAISKKDGAVLKIWSGE